MEITLLIKTIAGLIVILGILVFILILPKKVEKKQKTKHVPINSKAPKIDLASLRHIIRNRVSSKKELKEALDLVIKYHGTIGTKIGAKVNPQFDDYMEILIMICRHPNTDKNIILNFDKELAKLNPEYKKEINESITKGLDSRSV